MQNANVMHVAQKKLMRCGVRRGNALRWAHLLKVLGQLCRNRLIIQSLSIIQWLALNYRKCSETQDRELISQNVLASFFCFLLTKVKKIGWLINMIDNKKLQLNLNSFYMKLQIINRLSLHSNNNLDSMLTCQRQTQTINNPQIPQFNADQFQPNYYSIREHQQVANPFKANQFSAFGESKQDYKSFFSSFDKFCSVKYEQKDKIEANHRRKLQNEIKVAMMERQNTNKRNQSANKYFLTQKSNQSQQKIQKISSPLELKNYYLGQSKQKDRIRKISSLVSIRGDQSTELSRKPGFIMKKNSSFVKRQSTEQLTLLEEALYNKENINTNEQTGISKNNGSNVDRQIWQSKERIAQIRKQLNQIYEMRRESASFKLKLF